MPQQHLTGATTPSPDLISWVRFLEACFGFFPGVIVVYMSDYRHKRHNVSSLLYHIVCPAKYRRVIFDTEVDIVLKDVCLDIAKRYEIVFLEIGTDKDHVHFLVQSVPMYSPTQIVQIIKNSHGPRDFSPRPDRQKAFVGWRVVVQRLLHQYGRLSWECSRDSLRYRGCGSKAVHKTIRNCIVKTSNWGCSKVRLKAIHTLHE